MTDHQALVYLLKSRRLNKRLHGWMLKLLDFCFDIEYRPGKRNQDADSLSRQAWSTDEVGSDSRLEKEEAEQLRTTEDSIGG